MSGYILSEIMGFFQNEIEGENFIVGERFCFAAVLGLFRDGLAIQSLCLSGS
jgi:hypothetical protein